jgi:hypothetical protein
MGEKKRLTTHAGCPVADQSVDERAASAVAIPRFHALQVNLTL